MPEWLPLLRHLENHGLCGTRINYPPPHKKRNQRSSNILVMVKERHFVCCSERWVRIRKSGLQREKCWINITKTFLIIRDFIKELPSVQSIYNYYIREYMNNYLRCCRWGSCSQGNLTGCISVPENLSLWFYD